MTIGANRSIGFPAPYQFSVDAIPIIVFDVFMTFAAGFWNIKVVYGRF